MCKNKYSSLKFDDCCQSSIDFLKQNPMFDDCNVVKLKPMKDAPHDGTKVLAWLDECEKCYIYWFYKEKDGWVSMEDYYCRCKDDDESYDIIKEDEFIGWLLKLDQIKVEKGETS